MMVKQKAGLKNSGDAVVNRIVSSEKFRKQVMNDFCSMLKIRAMAPENGGNGELERAKFLQAILKTLGFQKVWRIDSKDKRAEGGVRPNIMAFPQKILKNTPITWLVTHMDTVPVASSELKLWKSDPFKPEIRSGKLFARGASDNGQDLISTLFAIAAVKKAFPDLHLPIGIVLVSDEETGSEHGIIHLIKNGKVFSKARGDEIIVPDGGSVKGDFVEIAEKGLLWMKVETVGKQSHASRPDQGLNAHRIASQFMCELDKSLHQKFSAKDKLYSVPQSTFEPTRRLKNVQNVNTIPGEDTFFVDCRILPKYGTKDILQHAQALARKFSQESGARITVSAHNIQEPAPRTSPNSNVVLGFSNAVQRVLKVSPRLGGMGGNTCAAFFRAAGFQTVVWGKNQGTAHSANEFARVSDIFDSIRVYSRFYPDVAAGVAAKGHPNK